MMTQQHPLIASVEALLAARPATHPLDFEKPCPGCRAMLRHEYDFTWVTDGERREIRQSRQFTFRCACGAANSYLLDAGARPDLGEEALLQVLHRRTDEAAAP